MLETPEKIGDQEEDNRGWIFQDLFRMKKGSEYMKVASQVDAPPSFIFKIYVCLETANNKGSTQLLSNNNRQFKQENALLQQL